MFKYLFNFDGINWWTLLGGLGLNFVLTLFAAGAGAALASNPNISTFYSNFGPPLLLLVIFLLCGVAGFVIGKIAGENQVKHAFMSSLGAVAPLLASAVLAMDVMLLLAALIAVAGNLNGGIMSVPKPKYSRPER